MALLTDNLSTMTGLMYLKFGLYVYNEVFSWPVKGLFQILIFW